MGKPGRTARFLDVFIPSRIYIRITWEEYNFVLYCWGVYTYDNRLITLFFPERVFFKNNVLAYCRVRCYYRFISGVL